MTRNPVGGNANGPEKREVYIDPTLFPEPQEPPAEIAEKAAVDTAGTESGPIDNTATHRHEISDEHKPISDLQAGVEAVSNELALVYSELGEELPEEATSPANESPAAMASRLKYLDSLLNDGMARIDSQPNDERLKPRQPDKA